MTGKLASRLLLSRRDMRWNQIQLAEHSGVSRQYISDLERDRITNPGVEIVEALANALNVPPEYLTGWIDDPSDEDQPSSIREGRIVYQVSGPDDYRRIQELLDIVNELTPEDQRILLSIAERLRRAGNGTLRIVGTA